MLSLTGMIKHTNGSILDTQENSFRVYICWLSLIHLDNYFCLWQIQESLDPFQKITIKKITTIVGFYRCTSENFCLCFSYGDDGDYVHLSDLIFLPFYFLPPFLYISLSPSFDWSVPFHLISLFIYFLLQYL